MKTPQVYGIEHIIYLALTLALTAALWYTAYRMKKSGKNTDIILRITAGVLLCAIVWNRISIGAYSENFWRELIPSSFCGMSSFLFSLTVLLCKRDSKILHCVAYVGALGSVLTLAYPDFIGQSDSIFFSKTISGLSHHSIMLALYGLIIITGYLKPTLKRIHILPLGLCVYITFGVFLNQVLGVQNAMYLTEPVLEGTILTWYVVGLLFMALHTLLLIGWELLIARRHRGGTTPACDDDGCKPENSIR